MDIYISVNGVDHEIPDTTDLTFKEWRLVKKETGMIAAEFEQALKTIDQDAWFCLCVIAVARDDPRPREEIEAEVETLNFLQLFKDWQTGEPDPPTEAVPTAGERSSPETTPAEAGTSPSLSLSG